MWRSCIERNIWRSKLLKRRWSNSIWTRNLDYVGSFITSKCYYFSWLFWNPSLYYYKSIFLFFLFLFPSFFFFSFLFFSLLFLFCFDYHLLTNFKKKKKLYEKDLSEYIRSYSTNIPSDIILKLTSDIAAGMNMVNEFGIVHRDLKPYSFLFFSFFSFWLWFL